MSSTFSERVLLARKAKGLTQKELAQKAGVSQATISDIERGRNSSSLEVPALAKALGLSIDALATGKDFATKKEDVSITTNDFAFIPLYDVLGACGNGYINDNPEVKSKLAFRKDWLKEAALQEKHLSIITAHGDSMWPTINDGAILLLNSQFGRLESGKVYALLHNGEVRVKRLFGSFTGEWRIASDNPNKMLYPDDTLSAEAMSGLQVIGRVVWAGGEL